MKRILTFLPVFLLTSFLVKGQITSGEVIATANTYLDHTWTATSDNIWDNQVCSGSKVVNTPFWVTPGTHTALPYCWGGNSTLADFDNYLTLGRSAGDDVTTTGAEPSCSVGVDCSGFVSRCYGLNSHYSTSMIGSGNYSFFGFHGSTSDVVVGDMFNKAGSHVRLVVQVNANGSFDVIESGSGTGNVGSPGLWRVFDWTYTLSQLSTYTPQYYTNMDATLDCSNAVALTCGVTYSGPSSTAVSNISSYGCNSWTETGPERVHTIVPSNSGTLTATVSNYTGDLDVYILGSCDPTDCLGTVSSSSATYANAVAGQTYYIVVDADDGSGSAYDLVVSCADPILDCPNAIALDCGVTYSGPSSSTPSEVGSYGCNTWTETGPERVHSITPATSGTLMVEISNFTGDLDVYILGSCDPMDCLGTVASSSATYTNAVAGETYYIVVDADDGSGSAYDLVVTCPPASEDITISEALVVSSTEVQAGASVDVQAIQNYSGTSSSVPDVYLHYYLSTDCTLDASDELLSDQEFSTINSTNTFETETQSLVIPNGTAAGSYQILFVADATEAIAETDESNNFACAPITVVDDVTLEVTAYTETCQGNNTHDTADDTYSIFINVDDVNGGATGQFDVSVGGTVQGTFDFGIGGTIALPANNTPEVLEITEVGNPTNSVTQWTTALVPCSPTCSDGMMNGDETDVDCGGTCPACILCADPPTGVSTFVNSIQRVTISWDNNPNAASYQVRYKLSGTATWTTKSNTPGNDFKELFPLVEGATYQYRVRMKCSDGTWSPFTSVAAFTMATCDAPTGISYRTTANGRHRFDWTHAITGIKYQIKYREPGGVWSDPIGSTPGYNFKTLDASTFLAGNSYQVKVRTLCDITPIVGQNVWSEFSDSYSFVAESATARLAPEMQAEENLLSEINIMPNPTRDVLTVTLNATGEEMITISVIDLLGNKVISTQASARGGSLNTVLDVSRLDRGYYFLVIEQGDSIESRKFGKL